MFPYQPTQWQLFLSPQNCSRSHGSGGIEETSTPLFIWGSGIKNWRTFIESTEFVIVENNKVPLYTVEQAQIAPLMSSLIGQSPPMNNFGKLPFQLMNVSLEFQAESLSINAFQMISQYEKLMDQFEKGFFSKMLPTFEISKTNISGFYEDVRFHMKNQEFQKVITSSEKMIDLSLEGIEYFQTYYKNILLFCTVMTFLGWIFYLLQVLQRNLHFKLQQLFMKTIIFISIPIIIIFLQKIPLEIAFYILLPIVIWIAVGENFGLILKNVRTFEVQTFLLLIFGCEIVVLSFFKKEIISLGFIALSLKRTNLSQMTSFYQKLHFFIVYISF
uniref:GPI ethanolamine phosphate transferase 1 n=1 Tax=Megaselia scalaris TaxID=36166 RepID=T1GG73_MEGSC